jgi:hypothetical protein
MFIVWLIHFHWQFRLSLWRWHFLDDNIIIIITDYTIIWYYHPDDSQNIIPCISSHACFEYIWRLISHCLVYLFVTLWIIQVVVVTAQSGWAARNETRRRQARRSQLQNHHSASDWKLFRAPSRWTIVLGYHNGCEAKWSKEPRAYGVYVLHYALRKEEITRSVVCPLLSCCLGARSSVSSYQHENGHVKRGNWLPLLVPIFCPKKPPLTYPPTCPSLIN